MVNHGLLPNFKSLINSHNKNIVCEQKKKPPNNYRGKTSCLLNGSCQHKNLVYSFKFSNPQIKQNHQHNLAITSTSTGLIEHTFKEKFYKHSNSLKYESKKIEQNFPISYGVKRKRRLIHIYTKIHRYLDTYIDT